MKLIWKPIKDNPFFVFRYSEEPSLSLSISSSLTSYLLRFSLYSPSLGKVIHNSSLLHFIIFYNTKHIIKSTIFFYYNSIKTVFFNNTVNIFFLKKLPKHAQKLFSLLLEERILPEKLELFLFFFFFFFVGIPII